jgi:DNA primase
VKSIEDLKEEVSIAEVLTWYGAAVGGRRSSEWTPINCPFCKDRSGSGSVNLSRGRFLCHQCEAPRDGKSGDIVDVVMFAEDFTETKDAIAWIERNLL